ncbi:hypothetical protein CEXT_785321 [Caerostris extrusa]|uniref:Uncharacterized protein n=1 Tax=Caerostris extrusa TaxID=172846 RepID=A0AAV4TT33_CAEEX|nr:hypothetical protein CEXT_785321 [Caerostris extrusa]
MTTGSLLLSPPSSDIRFRWLQVSLNPIEEVYRRRNPSEIFFLGSEVLFLEVSSSDPISGDFEHGKDSVDSISYFFVAFQPEALCVHLVWEVSGRSFLFLSHLMFSLNGEKSF